MAFVQERSLISARGNAQGHYLEDYIKGACQHYKELQRAYIEQVPEPFRVTKKLQCGRFEGRFLANAQPDFMGTLAGGRAICFEAKYTAKARMQQSVVTETQAQTLEQWWKAGAYTGVCISVGNVFSFIPWKIWRDMKTIYGRKYITAQEADSYRVKFDGRVMFLDYEKLEQPIDGRQNK